MPSGDGSPWKTPWKPYVLPSASVCRKRQVPPLRVSYRSMVVVRSRGPSHCTSRPGSVWARNTRSRGASNSRVIMIIGMPGSAVIAVLLIVVPFAVAAGFRRAVVFLGGLQRGQQVVEPLVALVPDPRVAGQPGGHLAQRPGLQAAEPGGRPPGPRDQAGVLKHLQVLGDRRLGHAEGRGELGNGRLAFGQPGQDRPPRRVGERPEYQAELVCCHP